jgi:uncharacterized repeat protein (TIGR01451 family)
MCSSAGFCRPFGACICSDCQTRGLTPTATCCRPFGPESPADPNPVVDGSNVTFTITVTNVCGDVSTNVVVTDSLPPDVSFVSALSGCAPTNVLSFLHIDAIAGMNAVQILFVASSNRLYTLEANDDLSAGPFTHLPGESARPGTGGPDGFMDTNVPLFRVYRIAVELP